MSEFNRAEENVSVNIGPRTYSVGRMYPPLFWSHEETVVEFLRTLADKIEEDGWERL